MKIIFFVFLFSAISLIAQQESKDSNELESTIRDRNEDDFKVINKINENFHLIRCLDGTRNILDIGKNRLMYDNSLVDLELKLLKTGEKRYRLKFSNDKTIIVNEEFICVLDCSNKLNLKFTYDDSVYIAQNPKNNKKFLWSEKEGRLSKEYPYIEMTLNNSINFSFDSQLWGFLNIKGKEVFPPKFDNVINANGVYVFKENGFYGLMSEQGKKNTSAQYKDFQCCVLSSQYNNKTYVLLYNDDFNIDVYSTNLEKIATIKNKKLLKYYSFLFLNRLELELYGKKGWFDFPSESYVEPVFDQIVETFELDNIESFLVKKDNKYGIVTVEGKEVYSIIYDTFQIKYDYQTMERLGVQLLEGNKEIFIQLNKKSDSNERKLFPETNEVFTPH